MATKYASYEAIPNADELKRIMTLCRGFRDKWERGELNSVNEDERAAFRIMHAADAAKAERELQESKQPTPVPPTPVPTLTLARLQKDEEIESFFKRCASMAAPVMLIHGMWSGTRNAFRDLRKSNQGRDARLDSLEARLTALEDRGLEYRGVFTPGECYRRGDCVTQDGSLWIARTKTTARPGVDPEAWQLAVKSGRNGRDGRDAGARS